MLSLACRIILPSMRFAMLLPRHFRSSTGEVRRTFPLRCAGLCVMVVRVAIIVLQSFPARVRYILSMVLMLPRVLSIVRIFVLCRLRLDVAV